jgi:hypothetical membrane protein
MLHSPGKFWHSSVFTFVIFSTSLFVVLTAIAMFFYPGGSLADPTTHGYSFSQNFFSDLGRWTTRSGASNSVSATLFLFALTLAGCGLSMFFIASPQFFRETRSQSVLSISGSVLGTLSGFCFVGVASFPADRFLPIHARFVMWAFRLFAAAVLFHIAAIFRHSTYPRRYGWALAGFLVLLTGYILLLQFGPSPFRTHRGEVIQAVGQKIIVYASIISVTFQAWGAKRLKPNRLP